MFKEDEEGPLAAVATRTGVERLSPYSRADLRSKLKVESGGVVFTTIQKFFPEEKGGVSEYRGMSLPSVVPGAGSTAACHRLEDWR